MSVVHGDWTILPVGAAGWELGEGLRSTGRGLVAVDLLRGALSEIDLDAAQVRPLAQVDGPLGAVAPVAGDDTWIAAVGTGVAVLDGTAVEPLGELVPDVGPARRVNDAVCDPAGRFWVGTMTYDALPGTGALHRVDAGRVVADVLTGLTVPNGPAFTPDGASMYLADSAAGLIHRIKLDDDGSPGTSSPFLHVPSGSPDGMTLDDEGCLWSAVWGAGQVWRIAPDGTVLEVLEVPAAQPTSVALHDGHVVVSSATIGLDRPGPADGHLLVAPCSVGAPEAAGYRME